MTERSCIDEYCDEIVAAGRKAYISDEDYTDNPYDRGTPERDLWDEGWWGAQQEGRTFK